MAKDITETGPVGLKGIKGINQQSQVDTSDYWDSLMTGIASSNGRQLAAAYTPDQSTDVGMLTSAYGLGDSIYDDAVQSVHQLEHLQDIRAAEQPWYAQLGAGLLKGVSLAATTFLDGTLGLVGGIVEMPNKGFSALWENEISNGLQEWNNLMEEWVPTYRSEEEMNNSWWQNMGTVNFWADGVLKNLGFTVGAFSSGNVFTKGLKAVGLLKSGIAAQVLGGVYSAVNEARIEANNNPDDWEKLALQELDDQYLQLLQDRGIEVTNYDDFERRKASDPDYQRMVDDIAERKKSMGATIFWGNTVLTSLDNIYSFGKLYKRGFQNAQTIAKKRATKNALNEGLEQAAREDDEVIGGIVKEGADYNFKKITKKQALGRGLKIGLVEGNEEMAQALISATAGNWETYDSPDAYYRAMNDPQAELKTKDFLTSVTEGFANTYGNGDRWEEFAIGAITGLLGMPTFGKVNNSDANTWLGKGKTIAFSGGLFGEIGNANRINREGQEVVDYMNSYVRKLKDQQRHFVQSQSFTDAMDGYAEAGNAFEYKNAEDNEDFAAISRFAKVGRLEDLRDIVKQDFANISDEELEKIARFTSPQDTEGDNAETAIGGWRNADGSYMSDTEAGRNQMRQELSEKRDKILKQIDNYEQSVGKVRAIANASLSEDQVNELAWLDWKLSQFDDRFSNIKEKNAETFQRFGNTLLNLRDAIDENSEEGKKYLKSVNNVMDFMSYLQGAKSSLELASRVAGNSRIMEQLMNEDNFDFFFGESGMSYSNFVDMMTNLQDAGKIAMAAKTFNERFQDFIKNPMKVIQNREKIDQQVQQQRTNIQNNQRRQQVEDSSVSDLVSAARDGEDLDSMFDVLPEDMDEAQADMDAANQELNARQRVQEAQNIITSTDALVGNDSQEGLIFQVEGASDQAMQDASTLMRQSEQRAESEDELLDLQREVFNDPNVLFSDNDEIQSLVNQGISQEEIAQYAQDRLDAARDVLNTAIGNLDEAKKDLEDLRTDGSRTVREDVTDNPETEQPRDTGHDATPAGETLTPAEKKQQEAEAQTADMNEDMNDALAGLEGEENGNPLEDTQDNLETEPIIPTPAYTESIINSQIGEIYNTDYSRQEEAEQAAYWKPTTTRLPIHRKIGDDRPFYKIAKDLKNADGSPRYTEAELKRMEAVYKELDKVGAFERVDNGYVKAGDTIGFTTIKSLNDEAGDVVILITKNGQIVGDLMSKSDLVKSAANRGMLEFVEKLERELESIPDGAYVSYDFGYTTHVSKNMVGKVPLTIKSKAQTLNTIASQTSSTGGTTQGNLLLGIAMASGKNVNIAIEPGRTKAQGQSAREMATMSPVNAIAGQPFMLVETSSDRRKYITVPFMMPRYDQSTQHTGLAAQVNHLITQILNADEKDFGRLKLDLRELLALEDVHINIDPATQKMKMTITPRGEKHQVTVFNDLVTAPDASTRISQALYGQPFQISRRYINGQINGLDYNTLVGEIAYTNLSQGGTHTVSDWFTINPIDKDGKEIKAKNPKSTGVNPEARDRTVTINDVQGNAFNIDIRTWEITNSRGEVMDPNKQSEGWNVYRAIAYGKSQNKDLTKPYDTPWGLFDATKNQFIAAEEQVITEGIAAVGEALKQQSEQFTKQREADVLNWLKRPEVTTAINSYIELGIKVTPDLSVENVLNAMISKETNADVKAALQDALRFDSTKAYLDSLIASHKPAANQSPSGQETVDFESLVAANTGKMKKSRLLGNAKRKALWEVLSPKQKHTIANDILHQEQWMRQLEQAWQPKTQDFNEKMLRGSVDTLIGNQPLNRENATQDAKSITAKERAWFDSHLPQLSTAERLHFVERIMGISQEGDPIEAWGQFSNGVITIANNAARGTLYHEAFHSVVHTLLTDAEYSKLYDAAKARYGNQSAEALEEILAEGFRRYMEIREKPVSGTIAKIFQTLKRWINNLFGKTAAIDNLFYRISQGQYANRETREVKDVTRNMWSDAQEAAKRIFFDEVYGQRLSEWDIHRINQKLSRLASQAGDSQPWFLRQSRNGGYYIAGYKNRPVTMDDYWSPGLWRRVRYRTNDTSSTSRQQYSRDKHDIANLSEEQVNYITERGVTPQEFNTWSNEAKDIFLRCM